MVSSSSEERRQHGQTGTNCTHKREIASPIVTYLGLDTYHQYRLLHLYFARWVPLPSQYSQKVGK